MSQFVNFVEQTNLLVGNITRGHEQEHIKKIQSMLFVVVSATNVRHSDGDAQDFVKRRAYRRVFRQKSFFGADVRRFYLEECTGCTR